MNITMHEKHLRSRSPKVLLTLAVFGVLHFHTDETLLHSVSDLLGTDRLLFSIRLAFLPAPPIASILVSSIWKVPLNLFMVEFYNPSIVF